MVDMRLQAARSVSLYTLAARHGTCSDEWTTISRGIWQGILSAAALMRTK